MWSLFHNNYHICSQKMCYISVIFSFHFNFNYLLKLMLSGSLIYEYILSYSSIERPIYINLHKLMDQIALT